MSRGGKGGGGGGRVNYIQLACTTDRWTGRGGEGEGEGKGGEGMGGEGREGEGTQHNVQVLSQVHV